MVAHVMCLTSAGGIPLFSRHKGEGDTMTFSKIASLYGIHMFLKSQNVRLLYTNLPDTTITWKEFEQSVILIVIASGTTRSVLDKFLDTVYGAMVLFVGSQELKNARNIEKLKKDIRLCNPIVDNLLHCLDVGDGICSKTDIVDMTECIMCLENSLFQTCLEGYTECLDSTYGCVLIHGCVAVATKGWWSLHPVERKLLTIAVNNEDAYTARDVPVFLPYKSPNVAFRLVSVTLIDQVKVLALCGPSPDISEIERFAVQCWKGNVDGIRNAEQCYPRNLPASINLDPETLGFLLANHKMGKFVLGKNAQYARSRVTGSHRLDILRTFYYQAVETFVSSYEYDSDRETEPPGNSSDKFVGAKETYLCSEYHKCYAVKHGSHVLCILCTSVVPTHTMKLTCHRILKSLLVDKQTCW